jgi:hydroxysqualene dehydroxylase
VTHVAVIGGGYSGMAAAAALAHGGVPVSVFEAGPVLGGRARRAEYRGCTLDNGQHILVGAYRDLLRMIDLVAPGARERLLTRLPLELHVAGRLALRTGPLPAPLHLAVALATARGLTRRERLSALAFVARLGLGRFRIPRDVPLSELLRRSGQSGAAATLLWEPLCTAALNTPPAIASAQVFLNVLRDTFGRSRPDSDLLLPRVDLSALFPEPAAEFVRSRGGRVLTGRRVARIEPRQDDLLVDGEPYSHVIVATAPAAAAALAATLPPLAPLERTLRALPQQPIVTVYLQYAVAPRLPVPIIGLADGLGQWVFDRGRLYGQDGLIAVVISAEGVHRDLSHDALASALHAELARNFPCTGAPQWAKVIAEKQATFSCAVGVSRPAHATPVPRLYLAGDYTDGDYPATLESAVRSGLRCASEIRT